MTPYLVTRRSNKKVWWKCARGHEWESTVSNRAKGQGCPDCRPNTSAQEIRIFCELKTIFAKVEWRKRLNGVECDILLPDYGAAIEYDGTFWHERRTKEDKNKNDELQRMGIAVFRVREMGLSKTSDRDIILSSEETRNSGITVIQRLLHKMLQTIHPQAQESEKVAEYLNRSTFANSKEHRRILSCLPGPTPEESLAGRFPEVAKQWHPEKNDPLKPDMFSPGTPHKVWWLCEKGHEWKQRINHRAYGVGCPFCAGQRADPKNNLAVKRPDIAEQWHPTDNGSRTPYMFTPYSNKRVWWVCSKGHKWEASIHNRSKGTGCPYCAGQKVSTGNNLAFRAPEVAEQWHPTRNGGLTPDRITHKSNRRVWWQCAKGHEWQATPNTRSRGDGCPHCRVYGLSEENNFASRYPQLAGQWHPTKNGILRPDQVTPMSGKRIWWICIQGHEWEATVSNRAIGKGCPECWKECPRKRKSQADTNSVQPPSINPKPKSP